MPRHDQQEVDPDQDKGANWHDEGWPREGRRNNQHHRGQGTNNTRISTTRVASGTTKVDQDKGAAWHNDG